METITASNVRLHFRIPGTMPTGTVRYAVGSCQQGALLVARSGDGVCAIFIGDQADPLREQIALAFPGKRLEEASAALEADLRTVAVLIDEPASETRLDLSVGGTPFQQRVWQALCAIPAGQTRSYAEIAQSLGMPDAARAVAGACAANVLAVAVPCHRVVRSDGSISGYRWGVERKRRLLQRERLQ